MRHVSTSREHKLETQKSHDEDENRHHDAGILDMDTGTVEITEPRRIATFFVYLNTLPNGIGHTE